MASLNQRIGFFGAGRMATALAGGILEAGVCRPDQALAGDVDAVQRRRFERETGVKTTAQNEEVASFCDVAVLAVKPHHVREVLSVIQRPFGGKLLVSIAAGISIATLEKGLDSRARVARVMPNTPALARAGASGYATGRNAQPDDSRTVEAILGAVGLVFQLPEKLLDAVTGLSGSGPAYIFSVIEALSDGGVEMGLSRDTATRLATQTTLGAAKLVLDTGKSPMELREMVTSPGGTTVEGLRVLKEKNIHAAFVEAVRAATEKSKLLGKSNELGEI